MTTGKTIALMRQTFVDKVMSLLFNMLSNLVITFLPRSQFSSVSSVAQSCPTLCDPMNCSTPGLPVHHQLPEFTQTHAHRVGDAIQLSHPLSSLLLLPPIPPSIRVFSNESTLPMRWPKYWIFSFSISPSNEHPGLISFRMDWLVKRLLFYFIFFIQNLFTGMISHSSWYRALMVQLLSERASFCKSILL